MSNCQRVIAVTIIVCLVPAPFGDSLTSLQAATLLNPTLAKQHVELLGVGAAVKVKLASGKKLQGSIAAIDTHGFDLISRREGLPQRISYEQLRELKLAKSTYRASGSPNAEAVRRVVAGLGVGKHVAVKVTSGKKFRGHVQAIESDHFILLADDDRTPVQIAYSDVQAVGKNLSEGAKIALIIVAAVGVTLIVLLALAAAVD